MLRVIGCFDISIMACLEQHADQAFRDLISSPLSVTEYHRYLTWTNLLDSDATGKHARLQNGGNLCIKQSTFACELTDYYDFFSHNINYNSFY